MTAAIKAPSLEATLRELVGELDVPPSKYEDAEARYHAVGDWLNADGSAIAKFKPEVYPHGSFALGTAVKPINDGEEYDVDAMCLLKAPPANITQQQLKEMVGDRLREHGKYREMLDPKEGRRRCWTLRYSDESRFHLDVTPAIPDNAAWLSALGVPVRFAGHAVRISCKDQWHLAEWPRSNPSGYALWFIECCKIVEPAQRVGKMAEARADVQPLPTYRQRLPLQRVVQILKRHRDIVMGDDCDKPISVIITTLAAKAYSGQASLTAAFEGVVAGLDLHVRKDAAGVLWIANPVNPKENFADRWEGEPEKAQRFVEWIEKLRSDLKALLTATTFDESALILTEAFGERDAKEVVRRLATRPLPGDMIRSPLSVSAAPDALSPPHKETPPWPLAIHMGRVTVTAIASRVGFRTQTFTSHSPLLNKRMQIRFKAATVVEEPFDAYWQVVNTGTEATAAGQLRGGFGRDWLTHEESTLYSGKHWIECVIVKQGQLVARSGPIFVNIA